MKFSDYLKKATNQNSYKIGLAKFASVSSKAIKEPSKAHLILKEEFFEEMKAKAISEIMEENKDIWQSLSSEDKEVLVKEREDKLWESVRSKGLMAFTLIFGISL
mgnify:CR=1 FL=1